jgi:hypothetical protein
MATFKKVGPVIQFAWHHPYKMIAICVGLLIVINLLFWGLTIALFSVLYQLGFKDKAIQQLPFGQHYPQHQTQNDWK